MGAHDAPAPKKESTPARRVDTAAVRRSPAAPEKPAKPVRDGAAERSNTRPSAAKRENGTRRAGPSPKLMLLVYVFILIAAVFSIDARHSVLTLNGDAEMTVPYGKPFDDPGASVVSTGKLFGTIRRPGKIVSATALDVSTLGETVIDYGYSSKGEEQHVMRRVTVADTDAPVITLVEDKVTASSWFTGYEDPGYSATDNLDGDLTDKVTVTRLADQIVYTVTDSSGNEAEAVRDLGFSVAAPAIVLIGGEEIDVPAAMTFTDPGYTCIDNKENDYTDLVKVSGSVIPYKVGDYTLTYTVSNDTGDTVKAERLVHIVGAERKDPVIPEGKTIYLTFDDGPGPYTNGLLDLLARYNVKVTFFVTGLEPDYADCIGRAYREGHAIGVHTFSHNYRQIYRSEQAFFDDFMACEELVKAQTGSYTTLMRFPGGSSNNVSNFNPGIMRRLANIMTDMGYHYFDWNVSSGDAGGTTSTSGVITNVTTGPNGVWKNDASVVLQHDIKDFSVAAVEQIIIWGQKNGYQFLPLQEDSYGAKHGIIN